jgi:hypothetical protein
MESFGNNTLAYYDTLTSGLVPCKVIGLDRNCIGIQYLKIKITANRQYYKKGQLVPVLPKDIVPRKFIHIKNGQYCIINGFNWDNVK